MVSSVTGAGKTGYSNGKKMKLDPYRTPLPKINSKFIKDLNARPIAMKLTEENRKKLLNISLDSDFLLMTPKAQVTK